MQRRATPGERSGAVSLSAVVSGTHEWLDASSRPSKNADPVNSM